ncbi:MAG: 7-cyano-7-deazaguanine synthase QueC [Chlamydiota bacterium]|nr:7-cyano-7-deazaguanine synthase QueC [Chlamydiota bacterium]
MNKKAVVVHSGGMDSSICLAHACREFGSENVLSISFSYSQRHSNELIQAKKICKKWAVDNVVLSIDCLNQITDNALMNSSIQIIHNENSSPNTLVVGRNGLMARLSAIHANSLGAHYIYMGVIEVEACNSGYRDCSRDYMNLMEKILRIDLDDPEFEIRTPVVDMTKKETMELAHDLGVLEYLLSETITCYEGIPKEGCKRCPACKLRNDGILAFKKEHPKIELPY